MRLHHLWLLHLQFQTVEPHTCIFYISTLKCGTEPRACSGRAHTWTRSGLRTQTQSKCWSHTNSCTEKNPRALAVCRRWWQARQERPPPAYPSLESAGVTRSLGKAHNKPPSNVNQNPVLQGPSQVCQGRQGAFITHHIIPRACDLVQVQNSWHVFPTQERNVLCYVRVCAGQLWRSPQGGGGRGGSVGRDVGWGG